MIANMDAQNELLDTTTEEIKLLIDLIDNNIQS
jgi:hypothetical protein